jgi:short-subunit dehydrogenase
LKSVAAGLDSCDSRIDFHSADLTKSKDLYNLVKYVQERVEAIDILVNCAGIFPIGPVTGVTLDAFDQCMAVNVRAPFFLCHSFLPAMVAKGWGRVVNIGSSSAFAGFKNTSIYCASKHALLGLTRSVYEEMRTKKVRVFSINPGSVRTEMGKLVLGQDFTTFLDPQDVAKYLVFLISFDSEVISEEVRLNRFVIK